MNGYTVSLIPCLEAKAFIEEHHYAKGSHYRPSPTYGLFDGQCLIGVLMIATPCSERVRSSMFGKEYKAHVSELHRLAIIDDTPKNTESFFIGKCLRLLKIDRPNLWGLVSFADSTIGHEGIIYQATNWLYCGMSAKSTFYLDQGGRLRHPRQCGVNITRTMAKEKGWKPVKRSGKHRYAFVLGNKKQRKDRMKLLKLDIQKKVISSIE